MHASFGEGEKIYIIRSTKEKCKNQKSDRIVMISFCFSCCWCGKKGGERQNNGDLFGYNARAQS